PTHREPEGASGEFGGDCDRVAWIPSPDLGEVMMPNSIWNGAVIAESNCAEGDRHYSSGEGRQAPVPRPEPDVHGLALEGRGQPLHHPRRGREEQGRRPVLSRAQARCDNNNQGHVPLWRGPTEVP